MEVEVEMEVEMEMELEMEMEHSATLKIQRGWNDIHAAVLE